MPDWSDWCYDKTVLVVASNQSFLCIDFSLQENTKTSIPNAASSKEIRTEKIRVYTMIQTSHYLILQRHISVELRIWTYLSQFHLSLVVPCTMQCASLGLNRSARARRCLFWSQKTKWAFRIKNSNRSHRVTPLSLSWG